MKRLPAIKPSPNDALLARAIVDSEPVAGMYAAIKFDDLSEQHRTWIAGIVRATLDASSCFHAENPASLIPFVRGRPE